MSRLSHPSPAAAALPGPSPLRIHCPQAQASAESWSPGSQEGPLHHALYRRPGREQCTAVLPSTFLQPSGTWGRPGTTPLGGRHSHVLPECPGSKGLQYLRALPAAGCLCLQCYTDKYQIQHTFKQPVYHVMPEKGSTHLGSPGALSAVGLPSRGLGKVSGATETARPAQDGPSSGPFGETSPLGRREE